MSAKPECEGQHLPPSIPNPNPNPNPKPEWEVLADLALRRLEKDYQRTLHATPIVRFKEGDIVSLAGMSTAVLEGAKGTVVGAIDPQTRRYPIRLSAPEVLHPAPAPDTGGMPPCPSIFCLGCGARLPRRHQVSAGAPGHQLRKHPRHLCSVSSSALTT